MHILFLTDNFPPEVNAPASRTFEHCREWVKRGRRVTVITCAPNFPKGEVFPGYRNRLWQREYMDGIEVIRVWSYITANEGFVRRVLDYQSFMLGAICASFFVRDVDLVIGTSPQFFTVCAAYLVSRSKRIPFVFELRDLWPESIKAVGAIRSPLIIRALEKIEQFLYRKATRIVSVTESFKRILMSYGIDGDKIDVVTNGVDISQFKPMTKDASILGKLGLEGKFVAGYIGTLGMAHGLETLIDAAGQLRDSGVAFLFLGDGARKLALRERVQRMKIDNVLFLDSVQKNEVQKYWALLDVSIVHLRKADLFTTVIPSKIFECMGMGVPVLLGVAGESAELVTREGIGQSFEPENVAALCAALKDLKANPIKLASYQANGVRAARDYDRAHLAGRMLNILDAVAQKEEGSPPRLLASRHNTP